MAGGRTDRGARRRTAAASVVVPFPRDVAGARLTLARVVPSGRSLLLGFAVLLAALAAYWGAVASSVFAIESVRIVGVSGAAAAEVERATTDLVGVSLLSVDGAEVERRIRALPTVAAASVDRSFPHELVIKIAAERPAVVLRQGRASWLVAASGKVVRELDPGTQRELPRTWVARDVPVAVGSALPPEQVAAVRAVTAAREAGLRRGIEAVRVTDTQLTLVLRDGLEVWLGEPSDVALKLAVAAAVLPVLDGSAVYLDVSVPERPVSGATLPRLNSKVELEALPSRDG